MTSRYLGRGLLAAAAALFFATPALAVDLTEVARFAVDFAFASDIVSEEPQDPPLLNNPKYIGTTPTAVAWDGSQLYVGGYNNGNNFAISGAIEVLDATRTGLVTTEDADFSDPLFVSMATGQFRGVAGMDISGGNLAIATDLGFASTDSIQLFDTSDNSKTWDLGAASITNERGGSGVAFDPGFNGGGTDQGVAWTKFGSGTRALQSTADGSILRDFGATLPGFTWLPSTITGGNFARSMTFDPDTGDIYVRRSNQIDFAERTGDNSVNPPVELVVNTPGPGNANFVSSQNIAFMSTTSEGALLVFNARDVPSAQAFLDVVKVTDTAGVEQTVNYTLLTEDPIGDEDDVGWYDFSFDPVSQTLALLDSSNRNVHIFQVGGATDLADGDFDAAGRVDNTDLNLLLNNWGNTSVPGNWTNNFTPNPGVNNDELNFLLNTWGNGVTAVPEPASVLVAALGLLGLTATRRR